MKIAFTGGGTGGHFYPLMAVAERVIDIVQKEKLVSPKMYYFGEKPYSPTDLYNRHIVYSYVMSGKIRGYFSFYNFVSPFKVFIGIVIAFFKLLKIYPDVVFAKGGYDSMPTCIAAWILHIPIIIHESDSIPGRTNIFLSKLASRIGVAFCDNLKGEYFDKNKTACIGVPILKKYMPKEHWIKQLPPKRPNILVSGGSQGSQRINDFILKNLQTLIGNYNIIHQTGDINIDSIKSRAGVILENYTDETYLPVGSIDFSKVYPYVDLVISRAGSSSIFEYSMWGIPCILIPLPESAQNHQYINAEYAREQGFADIILEENMSSAILIQKIKQILENNDRYKKMSEAGVEFSKKDAADIIAKELIRISLRV